MIRMLNPFDPQQDRNPYPFINAEKRVLQDMEAARVKDRIFEVVQKAYEDALRKDNIVVLMPQALRKHLLAKVMKQVLSDMLTKLDNRPGA